MKRIHRIVAAMGGVDNIVAVEPCVTRLRCEVEDAERIDRAALREAGVHGLTVQGTSVQVIVGPDADLLASDLEEWWSREGQ